jgi:hypothetical protein
MLVFFIWRLAMADRIDDFNEYIADVFNVSLPWRISRSDIVACDPGYLAVRLSEGGARRLRELDFSASGYSGWEKYQGSRIVGYEAPLAISGGEDGAEIYVNRKRTPHPCDEVALYLDCRRGLLILNMGKTSGAGFALDPMRLRKALGLPDPNAL